MSQIKNDQQSQAIILSLSKISHEAQHSFYLGQFNGEHIHNLFFTRKCLR